ncbi:non-canonical purine NTP diphosphatase [Flavobacteriaceae bacterium AU392]|nr:non-canonical purine NTP diphosphatase [Flavobacteriaceae bacterium]RKM83503.1 non-canonical purine NTP diphosphatase [Flavobacteriaceae bacterium AU392]
MELVFATNNRNKIKEVQALMPEHITIVSLKDIGCFEDIPENQNTIEGNAIEKVNYVIENYGYDCFADDTGLEINALNGEPGVYSARYAGEQRSSKDNMNKVLQNLKGESNRVAQFKTIIALSLHNKGHIFAGICEGSITETKSGKKGFGYDPIFKPKDYKQTFAEMDLELKNKIGHRGKAVQQLVQFLNSKFKE